MQWLLLLPHLTGKDEFKQLISGERLSFSSLLEPMPGGGGSCNLDHGRHVASLLINTGTLQPPQGLKQVLLFTGGLGTSVCRGHWRREVRALVFQAVALTL